ncbi:MULTISPECIES: DNA-binding domain-containing protein [Bacillus]|uniref:Motility repressor MogR n=1 Tax=Bacillus cereus TaxID=1396 RepID=A0A2A8J320_BACCE|nr:MULTISPECIES: DNA-binding domain-containing protein [Bacillus]MDH4420949.1 DNA-binding domain-containing protein [Bacillus cereus]PER26583.1 motility repressor MogR [Bacillus cereus]PFA60219.1 motility repressor MogR [Bacillus sp. AFS015896]PGL85762.1 motility repressor MogR [Bacillus sp. AFS054943]PGT98724.1 motility repressor MogR [Bacillus cereus]
MYHHTAINVLSLLQNMSNNEMNDMKLETEFKKIEKQFRVKYEELVDLYNRMVLFQIDIEKSGGMRAYEKSAVTWLKSELELLYEVYQFCQRHGLNIANISKYVSKNELNIFPKTESQLQNTYYKLKKQEIPFENIEKQKPGRKRKYTPAKVMAEPIIESQEEVAVVEEDEKSLVTVLSGIVDNFDTIRNNSEKKEHELHQFMEGIYKLSSMAAERLKDEKDARSIENELQLLQAENERLQREKEELVQDVKDMTCHVINFITSSDIDQIRQLPKFVKDCKKELHKIGLYNAQDGNMKIMVDRRGQVVTVTP